MKKKMDLTMMIKEELEDLARIEKKIRALDEKIYELKAMRAKIKALIKTEKKGKNPYTILRDGTEMGEVIYI
jgi:hypothetical protein